MRKSLHSFAVSGIIVLAVLTSCHGGGGGESLPADPAGASTKVEWTWVSGSNTVDQSGVYGPEASSKVPGARDGAVSWIDGSGNFWLFGGQGYDSTGNWDVLNDLWRYKLQ